MPMMKKSSAAEDVDTTAANQARGASPNCGDIWIDGDLVIGLAGAALFAFAFLLNNAITMAGRKRKRRKRNANTPIFNWALHPLSHTTQNALGT